MRERFSGQGLDVHATSPVEFSTYLRDEIARWGKVIAAAGVRVD